MTNNNTPSTKEISWHELNEEWMKKHKMSFQSDYQVTLYAFIRQKTVENTRNEGRERVNLNDGQLIFTINLNCPNFL